MSNKSTEEHPIGLYKAAAMLVAFVALGYILYYSKAYAIPFIMAIIIWFIIHELRENLQMIPYIKRKWPIWVQSTVAFFFIFFVLGILGNLIYINITALIDNIDLYEENFYLALFQLNQVTGMDLAGKILSNMENFDPSDYLTDHFEVATGLIGDIFLIILYVIFLLIEEAIFPEKLRLFYPSESKQRKTNKFSQKMDKNISRYLTLKTFVSFLTGALSYLVLWLFDIDSPFFWAMIIFVLNYIPTIGSLIATLFPALFAVLQTGQLAPFAYILMSIGAVQVIIGNILEPKLMGNSLNISSLVVMLSLTVWGAIWGVMGMILSVPITVMIIIVCEEIPSLRYIAIALSERGSIASELNEEDD